MENSNRRLSPKLREELLRKLKSHFESNMIRYERLDWSEIVKRLGVNADIYHNGAESYYAV